MLTVVGHVVGQKRQEIINRAHLADQVVQLVSFIIDQLADFALQGDLSLEHRIAIVAGHVLIQHQFDGLELFEHA